MDAGGKPKLLSVYQGQLDEIAAAGEAALMRAEDRGRVVIVTNAEKGWIELSCRRWLPSLMPVLKRFECLSARSANERPNTTPFHWKAQEFEKVIGNFYSPAGKSWKNVLSIGDSPQDRDALRSVTSLSSLSAVCGRCRTKTVKFQVRPSIDDLVTELCTLEKSFEFLVDHDGDLDIVIGPKTPPASPHCIQPYVPPHYVELIGPQGGK
jgi:hypothetical protein